MGAVCVGLGMVQENPTLDIPMANLSSEAWVVFKARKNHDGCIAAWDLLQQVDKAINIFELKMNGFTMGLFMCNNALSHQHCADNALLARKMQKNPNEGWTHQKDRPKMCNGTFGPNKMCQEFYYPLNHLMMPGWFKGMEQIIHECDLWLEKGMLTGAQTAAANVSYSISLTSWLRNWSSKNSLPHKVTSVTFTQRSIAS